MSHDACPCVSTCRVAELVGWVDAPGNGAVVEESHLVIETAESHEVGHQGDPLGRVKGLPGGGARDLRSERRPGTLAGPFSDRC